MTLGEMGTAMRRGRVKEIVRGAIVLLNGLAFHWFGTSRWLLGVRDSWQSESRMTRELEKHFTDVRVTTGRHFLVEATRRYQ